MAKKNQANIDQTLPEDLSISDEIESEESTTTIIPKTGFGLYFVLFIIFFCLFLYISAVFVEKHGQISQNIIEIEEFKKRVAALELENLHLKRKVKEMATFEGQEKIARQKLKLIKPDELIIDWEESDD